MRDLSAVGRKLFPLTEAEFVQVMKRTNEVNATFGPSGAALIWDKSEPMPEAVRQLGLIRGVLNQNMDGAGI